MVNFYPNTIPINAVTIIITIGFTSVNINNNKTIMKVNKLIRVVIFVNPIVNPDPKIKPITAGDKNLRIFCWVSPPVPFLKKSSYTKSYKQRWCNNPPKVATIEPIKPYTLYPT